MRSPQVTINNLQLSAEEVGAARRTLWRTHPRRRVLVRPSKRRVGIGGWTYRGIHRGGTQSRWTAGNTGLFINGRELHVQDVMALQRLALVYPGRYWVDAQGNFGYEGGPALGNLILLARMAGVGGHGGGPWSVTTSAGAVGGDGQGFMYFNDGKNFWST